MSVITMEDALLRAQRALEMLAPMTEAEAWQAAQDDPYGLLHAPELEALEELDRLDFLATGQSRGCHYGRCRTDPQGNPLPIDTSWRSSVM